MSRVRVLDTLSKIEAEKAYLEEAARVRKTKPWAIQERIFKAVMEGRLIDAVLDDGVTTPTLTKPSDRV